MPQKQKVFIAKPFRGDAVNSGEVILHMLLRQWNFPYMYTGKDKMIAKHLHKCDRTHLTKCMSKFNNLNECCLVDFLQKEMNETVFIFTKDALCASSDINWTGYRILVTVHKTKAIPIILLEIFAKHPQSKIEVYSGMEAPNVLT